MNKKNRARRNRQVVILGIAHIMRDASWGSTRVQKKYNMQ
jgi:hypothetical protein